MRKRVAVGASEPVASTSGSDSAEEDLFAAEQRLGSNQPAAEPVWTDDDEAQSGSDQDSEDSQQPSEEITEASGGEQEVDTDADSEASSEAERSASDDDELDTAIVDYAAAAHQHADESEPHRMAAV